MDAAPYIVKVSRRARHVRITVHPGGAVVVTMPERVNVRSAQEFVASKLEWITAKVAKFSLLNPIQRVSRSRADVQQLKVDALALVESRIQVLNATYGFSFKKITIRNQKTRWGSCSKRGNLSFNYRITLLSPRLADYLIVHELCHLGEMNHSLKFWNLVARTFPDYKELRRELRKSSSVL